VNNNKQLAVTVNWLSHQSSLSTQSVSFIVTVTVGISECHCQSRVTSVQWDWEWEWESVADSESVHGWWRLSHCHRASHWVTHSVTVSQSLSLTLCDCEWVTHGILVRTVTLWHTITMIHDYDTSSVTSLVADWVRRTVTAWEGHWQCERVTDWMNEWGTSY